MTFEDSTVVQAEYVIGADGIKSQVRQQLFYENEFRDSGQVAYRGVVEYNLPDHYQHEVVEAWGKGKRFGVAQVRKGLVYWYLVVDSNLYREDSDVNAFAKGFHPLAIELVKATSKDKLIVSHMYDLKPIHTWAKDNVCIIGDAAHATTPNLGQGACQAIEDAYVLGELLKKYSLAESFRRYPEIRRQKAHDVVNTSWVIGKVSHAKNPILVGVRNFVLQRLTPQSTNLKQLDKLFTLNKVD